MRNYFDIGTLNKIIFNHSSRSDNDSPINWTNLYIKGRTGFCEEMIMQLESSNIPFMQGYFYDTTPTSEDHEMIWVDESVSLRDIKLAIGGKLIWKYRLQFYSNLNEFMKSMEPELSENQSPVNNGLA